MKITSVHLSGIKIIEPRVFQDERGFFFESFNQHRFAETISRKVDFAQDSHSRSSIGVLRGLHYQLPPKAQGKLVRVVQGRVFDVVVDIRKSSPTFGQWHGEILSSENKKQIWIPEGFAHGFASLSETADFLYKTTHSYAPECERSIRWDDETINIDWPTGLTPIMSSKDLEASDFLHAEVFA
ncbi:MAG: dTDP-4-dehydrorhamnose 3,5-epimerase [Candidatus Eutrophobiaceae bacterium]